MVKNKKSYEKIEQKKTNDISSTVAMIPFNKPIVLYDLDVKGEIMRKHFFPGFPEILLEYLGSDIAPTSIHDKKTKKLSDIEYPLTFFGKRFEELMDADAALIANLLLRAEENGIEIAVAVIKNNPDLLRVHTMVFDQKKRCIKGTLLQIAAMAGDMDLVDGIVDEKDQGVVRRLIQAGDLSRSEIIEQLKCITSEDAQQKNKERNERILNAIIKFAKGIIYEAKRCSDMRLPVFQAHCQAHIAELEKDLDSDPSEIITAGFIFDPKALYFVAEWFKNHIKDFDDWYSVVSDVFWINGWGKLQDQLSSRDAHIIRAGIANIFDGVIPSRSMDISDDACDDLFNTSSCLGVDYCLGCYGTRLRWAIALHSEYITESGGIMMYSNLSDIKIELVQKITDRQDMSYKKMV